MPQSYTPEFKKKIVRLHEEEDTPFVKDNGTLALIPGGFASSGCSGTSILQ